MAKETIVCQNCGTINPSTNNFCSKCAAPLKESAQSTPEAAPVSAVSAPVPTKKKKGHGCLITLAIILGVILLIIIIAVATSKGSAKPSSSAVAAAGTSTSSEKSASSNSVPESYGINQPASENGITMTLLNVKQSNGSDMNAPDAENVFVLCEFLIQNNSSKDLAISSELSFDAYADDTSTSESLTALVEKGNKSQLDGTIAAGKKMDGVIGYEIPKGWKTLEIRLNPDGFSFFSHKVTFSVRNK